MTSTYHLTSDSDSGVDIVYTSGEDVYQFTSSITPDVNDQVHITNSTLPPVGWLTHYDAIMERTVGLAMTLEDLTIVAKMLDDVHAAISNISRPHLIADKNGVGSLISRSMDNLFPVKHANKRTNYKIVAWTAPANDPTADVWVRIAHDTFFATNISIAFHSGNTLKIKKILECAATLHKA